MRPFIDVRQKALSAKTKKVYPISATTPEGHVHAHVVQVICTCVHVCQCKMSIRATHSSLLCSVFALVCARVCVKPTTRDRCSCCFFRSFM